ncbi:hypothetical protein [Streptacidiphilus pinicola]|nr:hypothetical protein [Streptacidiphilus pinicola]
MFKVLHKEDVATGALCFMLQRHPAIRTTLLSVLAGSGISAEAQEQIRFMPQARSGDDKAVVDIEGRIGSRTWLSIEVKLNAPLQPTQPVVYAERLEGGGSLLFVCPAVRIPRLRAELMERCAAVGLAAQTSLWERDGYGVEWLALTGGRRVGITSWRLVLDLIRPPAFAPDPGLASDHYQLEEFVATHEQELWSWGAGELTQGGFGLTFAKAIYSTRVLCGIVAEELGVPFQPSWQTTRASDASSPARIWDWFGSRQKLPGADAELGVCFEPIQNWGACAASPLRFGLTGMSDSSAERLRPVFREMHRAAQLIFNEAGQDLEAPVDGSDLTWWMLPFPVRSDRTDLEMYQDMKAAVEAILKPLKEVLEQGKPDRLGTQGLATTLSEPAG